MAECEHSTIRSRVLPGGAVRITCEDCEEVTDQYTRAAIDAAGRGEA